MLHFILDSERDPRITTGPAHDRLVGGRPAVGEEHVGLIGEGFPGYSLIAREAVPSGKRQNQALGQQTLTQQHIAQNRRSKDPDMDGPVLERGDLLGGREIAQLDVDAGVSPGKESDNFGAVEEVGPQGAAHDELPDLTTSRPSHGSSGLLGLRDHGSSFGEEQSTGIRQLDVTCCPVEEGRLQLGLQTPNLLAQRRLRYVELRRGPPEVELLGDREEVPQMTQLHDGSNSYHRPLNRAGKIYWTVDFADRIVASTPRARGTARSFQPPDRRRAVPWVGLPVGGVEGGHYANFSRPSHGCCPSDGMDGNQPRPVVRCTGPDELGGDLHCFRADDTHRGHPGDDRRRRRRGGEVCEPASNASGRRGDPPVAAVRCALARGSTTWTAHHAESARFGLAPV